ncbi:MAG: hypothetical protein FJW63_09460 [Actinobacteria bacterium]|nr:hypothetical protein [Actinomycetota bacterium]
MSFKEQAVLLKDVLGLDREPIAITFTNEEISEQDHGKISMCRALKLASKGESFVIDEEVSTCPGGSWHCGLTEAPSQERKRRLQWFLTKGEKLTHSIVSFERMQKLTSPPPTDLSERIVMCPLENAEIRPDIVLFLCNGEQACRIIALDTYWDGIPPKMEIIGALCHSAIAYPIMSGSTNLSLGDWTARSHQQFDPDIVFLSLPYERMGNLLAAIPECSAGTAKTTIPEDFRHVQE